MRKMRINHWILEALYFLTIPETRWRQSIRGWALGNEPWSLPPLIDDITPAMYMWCNDAIEWTCRAKWSKVRQGVRQGNLMYVSWEQPSLYRVFGIKLECAWFRLTVQCQYRSGLTAQQTLNVYPSWGRKRNSILPSWNVFPNTGCTLLFLT